MADFDPTTLGCASTLTAELSTATPLEATLAARTRVTLDPVPAQQLSFAFHNAWTPFATGRRTYGNAPQNPASGGGWIGTDDWYPG